MPRGAKPKPTAVKIREGNPGKRKITPSAKVGSPDTPTMPKGMPAMAQSVWKGLVPELLEADMLRTVDQHALESLCMCIARQRQARDELTIYQKFNEGRLTIVGAKGGLIAHPAVAIERAAAVELRQWCERFGLDPMARTRLGSTGAKGKTIANDIASTIGAPPRLKAIAGGQS